MWPNSHLAPPFLLDKKTSMSMNLLLVRHLKIVEHGASRESYRFCQCHMCRARKNSSQVFLSQAGPDRNFLLTSAKTFSVKFRDILI